jgi:hypothetical protein
VKPQRSLAGSANLPLVTAADGLGNVGLCLEQLSVQPVELNRKSKTGLACAQLIGQSGIEVEPMGAIWQRVAENLIGRLTGPLHLRLLMQPAIALFFGFRDGLKDAREDKPAYFWAIFRNPAHAKELLKGGLKAIAKILIVALVLDAIYQIIALRWFYPGEAILVALLLAFVPYLLIRGPANRISRWWASRHP